MCDFCGNITNQIAAQVTINLVRDCCATCVKQFVSDKPVPLAITPMGELVKKEDL